MHPLLRQSEKMRTEQKCSSRPQDPVLGQQHWFCSSAFPLPLVAFFYWFYSSWVFIPSLEKGGSGKVWGLPFIGSSLTWKQGNGMFHRLTDRGVVFSFI